MAAPIPEQRFGRLTVVRFSHTQTKNKRFLCRCDCGVEIIVIGNNLTRGHSTSCGCFQREGKAQVRHGHAPKAGITQTYLSWAKMKQRCLNPKQVQFKWYGGRGITVCERWLIFDNFLADMGERPSRKHTINRINNDGNYEPSNCEWSINNHRH
ncbi:MAG TPA: hypothetical protein VJ255_19550 [Candidatus Acidoferrum sp.]|jgi:hypothetical protein|nr:hypothetical protein [Candidatus Acidoferrum sp.]